AGRSSVSVSKVRPRRRASRSLGGRGAHAPSGTTKGSFVLGVLRRPGWGGGRCFRWGLDLESVFRRPPPLDLEGQFELVVFLEQALLGDHMVILLGGAGKHMLQVIKGRVGVPLYRPLDDQLGGVGRLL